MIQPNCRTQFTAADVDFIVSVFSLKERADSLVRLFSDPDSLDVILDDEAIFRALLEHRGCLEVSEHFYFYIMVRRVLCRSGIEDRMIADYVAAMLAEFAVSERARSPSPGEVQAADYLVDLLAALEKADDGARFLIRAHVGNRSLFLSGIFPECVHYRAQFRGAPEMSYYEALGSANYRVAGAHPMARRYDLAPIFMALSEQFHAIRLALNDMSDRLITVGDHTPSVERLLRASSD